MADTPTSRIKIREMALASDINSWGAPNLNENMQSIDDAIAGVEAITLNSTSKTLTTTNYASNEYRNRLHNLTGTPGGVCTVTIPAVEYVYRVFNQTTGGYPVIWKTSGGTGVYIPSGACVEVFCDGTDCYLATQFSGLYPATPTFSSGTLTLDARQGDVFAYTITATTEIAISNTPSSRYTLVYLMLTNGGSQTVTYPAATKWTDGQEPPLTVSGRDILAFLVNPGATVIDGFYSLARS